MAKIIFFVILIAAMVAAATSSVFRHKRGSEIKNTGNATNGYNFDKRSDAAGTAPLTAPSGALAEGNLAGNQMKSAASAVPDNEPLLLTSNVTVAQLTVEKKPFDSQSPLNRVARGSLHRSRSYHPFFGDLHHDPEFGVGSLRVSRDYLHPYVSISGMEPFTYPRRIILRDAVEVKNNQPSKGTDSANNSQNNQKNAEKGSGEKGSGGSAGNSGSAAKENTGKNSETKADKNGDNKNDSKDSKASNKKTYKRRLDRFGDDFHTGLTVLTDNRQPFRFPRLEHPSVQIEGGLQPYKPKQLNADNFNTKLKPLENILKFANILLYKVGGGGDLVLLLVLPLITRVRQNPSVDARALSKGRILEDFGRFLELKPFSKKLWPCLPKPLPCLPKPPPCLPRPPPCLPRPPPCFPEPPPPCLPPIFPPCEKKFPSCGHLDPVHPLHAEQPIRFESNKRFEVQEPLEQDQQLINPKHSVQWNAERSGRVAMQGVEEQDSIRPERPVHFNFKKNRRFPEQSQLEQNQDYINTDQAYQWSVGNGKRVSVQEPLKEVQSKVRLNVKRSKTKKRANKRNENLPHSGRMTNALKNTNDFDEMDSMDYMYNMDTPQMPRTVGRSEGRAVQSTDIGRPLYINAPDAENNNAPSNLYGNAIDIISNDDEETEDDEFELRCPVHYEKKSVADGDIRSDNAKEGVVEVCSCRLFKKKKNA